MGIFGKIRTTSFEDRLSNSSGVSGSVSRFSPGRFESLVSLANTKTLPYPATLLEWRQTAVLAACCRLL